MSWKDKFMLGALTLALLVLVVMCSSYDHPTKVASVVGDTEVHKYEEDSYVCFVLVNPKNASVGSISCLKK